MGPGTYGSKKGRPPKKKSKTMGKPSLTAAQKKLPKDLQKKILEKKGA
jgi:hypothetical protein